VLAWEVVFWLCVALLVYAQVGYPLLLAALVRVRRARPVMAPVPGHLPLVSLIVAAYDEEAVIARKVADALALDYPRDRLQIVVASDGSSDATAVQARRAGADLVLELPRGGKIRAQDAAVAASRGDIVAFSDANSTWEPDALATLVAAFGDPKVGYACGQVAFVQSDPTHPGTNQEGLYWRYEMALRALESRLGSITAGNGAIYATRRTSYIEVDPIMGHDLSFPFNMVKRGWRAVYVPAARATEKMVPSIEGEFARKRRMMSHTWPIVVRGGLLSPRGYPPLYALMIASHRALRYVAPFLHVGALVASFVLGASSVFYAVALALQLALVVAALMDRGPPRHARGLGAGGGHALMGRRAFDVAVAGLGLLVSLPLLALAALAIRLESRGGVIYRQRRVGLDGREFDVLKLRTMVDGAEHIGAGMAVSRGDARITRVGTVLRRTSLDELPNLVNVLRGEMAIVGPRPTLPSQVAQYTERERGRLAVAPGITGWAQVNGRTSLPWAQRIELDLWYIEHRSWRLDLTILWRSARLVVQGEGLYKGETGGWQER
jgi:lipopolysaccharide/colanic/teichoic acid biosynthesis glycosyltransferase